MHRAKHGKRHLGVALGSLAAKEAHALQTVLASPQAPQELIHDARRHCRKLRSLLAFLAAQPVAREVAAIDGQLKQLIHGFADLRDAHMAAHTAQRLIAATPAGITPALLDLLDQRSALLLQAAMTDDPGWWRRRRQAERIAKAIETLPWPSITPGMAKGTLKHSSKRMKKARLRALRQGGEENFHRWRRRARPLRYQLDFLRKAGPHAGLKKSRIQRYGARIKRLRPMIDRLGRRQDFHSFLQTLDRLPATAEVIALRKALARTSPPRWRPPSAR